MPDRKHLTAALTLLCVLTAARNVAPAAICAAQRPTARDGATNARHEFRSATVTPETSGDVPAAFDFEMSGYAYHIRSNGGGRRTKDAKTRLFNLRLDGGDAIRQIYFAEYERNVLLVCEVSDGARRAGFVARLEQPSMRVRWRREIPTAHVGRPLRDKAALYLTAARFVARLDLDTGQYVWQHAELDRLEGLAAHMEAALPDGEIIFPAFDLPELAGDEVLFRESPVYNRRPKLIRIERLSGRIVRVE